MKEKNGRPSIAVLAGGDSSEREVSLLSGRAISAALSSTGCPVKFVDVVSRDIPELNEPFDVFFIALHGGFGEDGSLQKMMDARGLTYTGCDAESSARCMDKMLTKQFAAAAGVNTPPCVLISKDASPAEIHSAARTLSPHVVVKPPAQGSSLGVSIVKDEEALVDAVAQAGRYGRSVLMEQYIAGRELHVGVLGCEALPIVEVRPEREFYDYEAKYGDSGTRYVTDVNLPPPVCKKVQDAALAVFKALGCRDFARVDVLLSADNQPCVLEVNTIPGFTEKSLLPMAAAAAGIAFPALCEKIVYRALHRARAVTVTESYNDLHFSCIPAPDSRST